MKALIFDSSSIISLALNNLLFILKPLKQAFKGEFYIPEAIKYELIDRSLQIKKFKLEALMIQKLVDEGVFKIKRDKFIKEQSRLLTSVANNTFRTNDGNIEIVHEGEMECLALYLFIPSNKKAIVIDERTTRMLCESPENLHALLERKHHTKIFASEVNYNFFRKFKIIRSSELAYMAYKLGIIKLPAHSKDAIESIMYALKSKGCAISYNEIEESTKL